VAVDPSRHTTIYQTLDFKQVLKSRDGGITWSASSRGLPNGVQFVAVDPVMPTRLYAGGIGGVWHSLDGGSTWKASRRPLPSGFARIVTALIASARPAGTVYAATIAGLFKSTNGGNSWQSAGNGLPPLQEVTALALAPSNPRILWASVSGGVFRSTNGGASWRRTAAPPDQVISLAVAAGNPSRVWAGTQSRGAFRTVDAGATWTRIPSHEDGMIVALAAAGPGLYAALAPGFRDPGGVLASGDGQSPWQPRNTGLTALQTFDVAIDPHHPEVLWAAAGRPGLYRSTVGGRVWDFPTQPPQAPFDPLHTDDRVTGVAFSSDGAVLYTVFHEGLWASDDAGASWRLTLGPETTPPALVSSLFTHPLEAATLYAKSFQSFFASRDSGTTWQLLNPGFDCAFNALAITPATPATLYAGGALDNDPSFACHLTRAALVRSTDGGATWTRADSGLAGDRVFYLAVDPLDPRILYATSGGRFGNLTGVSKSLDGGASWSGLGPPVVGNLVFAAGGGTLWGSSQDTQVFASRDGGASWQSVGGPQVRTLLRLIPDPADPDRLYAATSGGLWVLEDTP
jgi:photosystem II stability/assembly factor-like uncharacterized protein